MGVTDRGVGWVARSPGSRAARNPGFTSTTPSRVSPLRGYNPGYDALQDPSLWATDPARGYHVNALIR